MTDQEYANDIYDARKAFNDAAKAASDAGLKVDVTLFAVPVMEMGYTATSLRVSVTKELTYS
jgi:hypothetical protein